MIRHRPPRRLDALKVAVHAACTTTWDRPDIGKDLLFDDGVFAQSEPNRLALRRVVQCVEMLPVTMKFPKVK